MKVLIVDDELDISEFISYNLKKEDYEVFIANNGSQALNIIKSHKPDLVLLDIMLPDVDGIEVCQEIRASGDQNIFFACICTIKS
jgi:two-component system alkaline phosphatase synthesis response regulator PhoP